MQNLKNYIRDINDFPKKGVMFRDITTMFENPASFIACIDQLIDACSKVKFDKIGAFDARGFPFAAAVAYKLGVPFFPIRKAGKLPFTTIKQEYDLEYGSATIEIHTDSVKKRENILLMDDLLATGGTMHAGCKLVNRQGANVVLCLCVIELIELKGREKLKGFNIESLLKY
jgi:adenine phosphoribosyltransferase